MLDWPAKINTLSGLAKEVGERTHSSAAVRNAVGFMGIVSLEVSFLGRGLGRLDPFGEIAFHGANRYYIYCAEAAVVLRSGG